MIATALERGESLDTLCAAVQPVYRDWNVLARQACQMLTEAKIAEQRRGGS